MPDTPPPLVAPDAPYRPVTDPDLCLADRYRLRRFVARGGMAEVWEAEDEVLGRPVAVKLLLPHLASDPSFRERFRREAIAAARLADPSVVATYDTGLDGDRAFIVMELVRGTTLRAVLAERGGLPADEAARLAAQVAGAIDYAHRCGIIHRDVKPANVLINPDGRVKVADFGIAKAGASDSEDATGIDLTGTGAVLGTAKYLSPEQIDGRPVDGRTDVYALGVVLYEMLCGRPPFVGTTDMAVGIQHLSSPPVSPRQLRAGIPRPLELVVLKAMAKDPDHRYQSAAEMQQALESVDLQADDAIPLVMRGDDTPARGTPAVSSSFARSERRWLIPAVCIVIVAIALGVGGVLLSRSDTGKNLRGPSGSGEKALAIAKVSAFDPDPGDGREHDEETPLLLDGDPSTVWSTSVYANPQFGNLKPGVGLVIDLGGQQSPAKLEVVSSSRGWSAEVLAVDGLPPGDRAGWGDVLDSTTAAQGDHTFDLRGDPATVVLLWITNLGESNTSLTIGELRVS